MGAPHRKFELHIKIGADTWDALVHEFHRVADHVEEHGPQCTSVGGGAITNHVVEIVEDPEMTNERYFELLDAYLEQKKEK